MIGIPNYVFQRVLYISYRSAFGTCFTLEVDGKQYIISANHVLKDFPNEDSVEIFHERQWKPIKLKLIGSNPEADIAVFSASQLVSCCSSLEIGEISYGQEVYFLGFPHGWSMHLGELNNDYPFPFVKRAILSNMPEHNSKIKIFYLDGHNNPGFSGGPVVFYNAMSDRFRIVSVISGYLNESVLILKDNQPSEYSLNSNSGIIETHGIEHALQLIHLNPNGYPYK